MRATIPSKPSLLILLILSLTTFSCAARPTIRVDYLMNPTSDALAAKKVAVRVVDERESKETLSASAKGKLKDFTGYFSLALSGSQTPVGIYEPAELFETAMKSKMENMGMVVPPLAGGDLPVVEVAVKDFFLDLADFKWELTLNIDVRFWRDNMVTAEQSVNGRAERVRFPSDAHPDKVLGEIFTDVMARVDLENLLYKGGY